MTWVGFRKVGVAVYIVTVVFVCTLVGRPVDAIGASILIGVVGLFGAANVASKKIGTDTSNGT
jgi:hypothetical protein